MSNRIFGELSESATACLCGRSLSFTDSFCPQCGRSKGDRAALPYPPSQVVQVVKQRSVFSRTVSGVFLAVGAVVCIIITIGFLVVVVPSFSSAVSSSSHETRLHSSNAQTETRKAAVLHLFRVGQPVKIGYWTYTVNGVSYGNVMYSGYGEQNVAQGQYIVIDLTAQNNDTSQSTFPVMHLLGADGTVASEASAGSLSPERLDMLTELNPGLSRRGTIVFDVRPQPYALQVSGGYTSSDRAYISLPLPKDAEAVNARVSAGQSADPVQADVQPAAADTQQ